MDQLLYLTASNTSTIIKSSFYNKPETGNILFDNGKTIQDLINGEKENVLVLGTDLKQVIITKDNKAIKINR